MVPPPCCKAKLLRHNGPPPELHLTGPAYACQSFRGETHDPTFQHGAPMSEPARDRPNVGLFVTCLVDLFRPSVGFAALKLLEDAGCRVSVPQTQTCCGQPAYNSGDRADAKAVAKGVIAAFEGFDHVVAPSGSCAGMIRKHYPALLADEPEWRARAEALSGKTFELVSFLFDVLGVRRVDARHAGSVTYHDSCSGLRELGIREQPRRLLDSVEGLTLLELPGADVCCGFGGTFCVKYPEISNAIVEEKTADIAATGAQTLLAGDLGCLLNMAGKLKREGHPTRSRHVAEVLAGMTGEPAIGEPG
jgi:L-lactate dehydrogenase complex protein LldE